jgi:hypothetical protein
MSRWLLAIPILVPVAVGHAQEERPIATLARDCHLGSGQACRDLAALYTEGAPANPVRAFQFLTEGCRLGDRDSCHQAADRRCVGWGTPRSLAEAVTAYRENCDSCPPKGRLRRDLLVEGRIAGAEALVQLAGVLQGRKSLERIWEDIKAADGAVHERKLLLEAVERIGPLLKDAKTLLRDAIEDDIEAVRAAAARALRSVIGQEAETLLERVRQRERSWALNLERVPDSWHRAGKGSKVAAIKAMKRGEDPEKQIPRLIAALDDERVIEIPTIDFPDYVWPAKAAQNALGHRRAGRARFQRRPGRASHRRRGRAAGRGVSLPTLWAYE